MKQGLKEDHAMPRHRLTRFGLNDSPSVGSIHHGEKEETPSPSKDDRASLGRRRRAIGQFSTIELPQRDHNHGPLVVDDWFFPFISIEFSIFLHTAHAAKITPGPLLSLPMLGANHTRREEAFDNRNLTGSELWDLQNPSKCHWDQIGLILRSARCTSKLDPGITFATHVAIPFCRGETKVFVQEIYIRKCSNKNIRTGSLDCMLLWQGPIRRGFSQDPGETVQFLKSNFLSKNRGTTLKNPSATLTNPCTC